MRTIMQKGLLFFKGLAMGIADLVPGVSGGTVALVTGIYTELLTSLKAFGPKAVKKLFTGNVSSFWQHINGRFLFPVVAGIICSIFCFASLIHYLLSAFDVYMWSFFFGLIMISFLFMVHKTKDKDIFYVITMICGVITAWMITNITPVLTDNPAPSFFFAAGALAICAMILPGLSGSFILLLLGLYDCVLQAVITFNFRILLIFSLGCICGLFCFCRFLHWLLLRFYTYTISFLSGLVLGSLNKVWPWKQNILSSEGSFLQTNISPWTYACNESVTNLMITIGCMVSGLAIVIFLEYMAKSLASAEK